MPEGSRRNFATSAKAEVDLVFSTKVKIIECVCFSQIRVDAAASQLDNNNNNIPPPAEIPAPTP